MSSQGKFYLVAVKQNDIEQIRRLMLHSYGLKSEVSAISILLHAFSVMFYFSNICTCRSFSSGAQEENISLSYDSHAELKKLFTEIDYGPYTKAFPSNQSKI